MKRHNGVEPAARGEDIPFFYFLCCYALVSKTHWILNSLREMQAFHPYSFNQNYLFLSWEAFSFVLILCVALYCLITGPSTRALLLLSTALIIQAWISQPQLGQPPFLCLFLVVLIVGSGAYLYFREGAVTREKMYALYAPRRTLASPRYVFLGHLP